MLFYCILSKKILLKSLNNSYDWTFEQYFHKNIWLRWMFQHMKFLDYINDLGIVGQIFH